MNDKLIQSQKRLHDSLFELYMQGGLELFQAGTDGLKRELIIQLETSALTPENGEIIHYYAANRWDEDEVLTNDCCQRARAKQETQRLSASEPAPDLAL
jgi:hypothetical protein